MLPHPVDVHVGKQLRVQRVIMGLSQEALARAVGITFQQVQKYERGVNRLSASRLFDFARVLGVPVSFFFEGYDNGQAAAVAATTPGSGYAYADLPATAAAVAETATDEEFSYEQTFTRETLELMRCFHRIKSPQVKRRFVDLMRAVADDKVMIDEEA